MAQLKFENVGKVFADGTRAVGNFSLTVEDGEFLVLVGPSGCGKSTLLRMMAGLEATTEGGIWIGSDRVNDLPAKARDIAMVFQNYALYPHMTVAENIGFSLKLRRRAKSEIHQRVADTAAALELTGLLERKPAALSGGQRQRVAMGRVIIREPKAFLMDEPLSNLDAKLRVQMRTELGRLHASLGTTTVYVTHDQVEAMTLGDRVAVLKPLVGKDDSSLQQLASPSELFHNPCNLFVAEFIGTPAMNLSYGRLTEAGTNLEVEVANTAFPVGPLAVTRHRGLRDYLNQELVVGIRPGDFGVRGADDGKKTIEAGVMVTEELGTDTFIHFELDTRSVETEQLALLRSAEDTSVTRASGKARFSARVAPDSRPRIGDIVPLMPDPEKWFFFDPDTSDRIGRLTT